MSVWFTTWPTATGPEYQPHDTEAQAEAHAKQLVDSQQARIATIFRNDQLEETS